MQYTAITRTLSLLGQQKQLYLIYRFRARVLVKSVKWYIYDYSTVSEIYQVDKKTTIQGRFIRIAYFRKHAFLNWKDV